MTGPKLKWVQALLAASVAINVLLAWKLVEALLDDPEKRALREQVSKLEQTNNTLYRVLPKNYYTRNDFAHALVLPTAVPTIRDCVLQFGTNWFIFDRTNTLIGVYSAGPNPFVTQRNLSPGYKCNTQLLDEQTQRRKAGAREWERQTANAHRMVQAELEKDDPLWGSALEKR